MRILLLLLFILASARAGAISQLGSKTCADHVNGVSNVLTISNHTLTAGTDVLFVSMVYEFGDELATVVWDVAGVNESATLIVRRGADNGENGALYELATPTAKTADITITFATDVPTLRACAWNLDDVDTTTPSSDTDTVWVGATGGDVTTTNDANDWTFGVTYCDNASTVTCNDTELENTAWHGKVSLVCYVSGSGSQTVDWTSDTPGCEALTGVGVEINHSAGAPAVSIPALMIDQFLIE